ncbi:hypothetical protein ACFRMQ_36275 [Kitasatospora sp. NPDC056783]|uniref:hypothetical protein n=1 Tax=Kitasatospora sp. NPDC056783 TaxID=3345943 RepID=UPI0036A3FB2A
MLYALGYSGFPASRVVTGPRPSADRLRALAAPVLALFAARGHAHDPGQVADSVRRTLPEADVPVLPDTSRHNVPMATADEVNRRLAARLAPTAPPAPPASASASASAHADPPGLRPPGTRSRPVSAR